MKKRVLRIAISMILILVMVFTMSACNKKKDAEEPTGQEEAEETEEKDGEESSEETESSEIAVEEAPSAGTPEEQKAEQEKFAEFINREFKETLEQSYTTLHMYYIDPEASGFDLSNVEVIIDDLDPNLENMEEDRAFFKDVLDELHTFDRKKLTRLQQDEYDALEWEAEAAYTLTDEKFAYYDQYYAYPNSLDTQLVSFFVGFQIRNEREAKDVVALINSLPNFIDKTLEYTKIQQEKELLITNFDKVASGCDDVLANGLDCFPLRHLKEDIDKLEGVSEEKKEEYKKEIEKAFEESYLPSFQKMKDGILALKDGYNSKTGFGAFPHGKEYFDALMNYKLGLSGMTGEKLMAELEEAYNDEHNKMVPILSKFPNVIEDYYNGDIKSGFSNYTEILEYLKESMLEDHPEVKHLEYNAQFADPEEKLEEQNTAAYFLIPPLDGDLVQQIRMAPSKTNTESVDTYTTIAHEGFPGHMYQYAYLYENNPSAYLKTLGTDGILEGYAVYAQHEALDYLKDLGIGEKTISSADTKISFLLYSMMDIGVNYEGWTLSETTAEFNKFGYNLTDDDTKDIYDFFRSSPCTYECYAYGYELIMQLREKAEKELGDKFNERDFNKALLDGGCATIKILERYIDEYIVANR